MIQPITQEHRVDAVGRPAGGTTTATGLRIEWQNGPLGRGADRKEPNGAFVETVIKAARDRLLHYQGTQFACAENALAIDHLEVALATLAGRTARRESAGMEGTHAGA